MSVVTIKRKLGERIFIGDNVSVRVGDIIGRSAVKLVIEAPREMRISREHTAPPIDPTPEKLP